MIPEPVNLERGVAATGAGFVSGISGLLTLPKKLSLTFSFTFSLTTGFVSILDLSSVLLLTLSFSRDPFCCVVIGVVGEGAFFPFRLLPPPKSNPRELFRRLTPTSAPFASDASGVNRGGGTTEPPFVLANFVGEDDFDGEAGAWRG